MKFRPRDEYEEEAFGIEPPAFDLEQRVKVTYGGKSWETTIRNIILRNVDLPFWLYEVEGDERNFDPWMLEAVS